MHSVVLLTLAPFGVSVQVALVWLVVVGQLPQFDARMLYWMVGQLGVTGLQLNTICLETVSTRLV